MTLNGKRDNFTLADFEQCGKSALLKRGRAARILDEVQAAVHDWPRFADEAGVSPEWRDKIARAHRLRFTAG
jgi:serine/threonine-protein kinase HipA